MKRTVALVLFSGLVFSQVPARSQQSYIKFIENDKVAILKTATTRFRKAEITVDLIGTVHIADRDYYQQQKKAFTRYDALLFEMIGRPGGTISEKKEAHTISKLQVTLKNFLELSFQLEEIDYTNENFVHADMTYHQFRMRSAKKGESMASIMLKAMQSEMMKGGSKGISIFQILGILISGNEADRWKIILGRQMNDIENVMAGIEGKDGSVIVHERNNVAISVLQEQISLGKKRLGIYYGAAHMRDFEKKLVALGFTKEKTTWYNAWTMQKTMPVESSEENN